MRAAAGGGGAAPGPPAHVGSPPALLLKAAAAACRSVQAFVCLTVSGPCSPAPHRVLTPAGSALTGICCHGCRGLVTIRSDDQLNRNVGESQPPLRLLSWHVFRVAAAQLQAGPPLGRTSRCGAAPPRSLSTDVAADVATDISVRACVRVQALSSILTQQNGAGGGEPQLHAMQQVPPTPRPLRPDDGHPGDGARDSDADWLCADWDLLPRVPCCYHDKHRG
jgi:hypothetical protein